MIVRHVRITGHVQGVFFRAWTREEARTIGVNGWIRNCPDGSVEAQLEGDEEAVRELLNVMREGPPGATVESMEIEEADPEGLNSFDVRN